MQQIINNFYDLKTWQEGHSLILKIYKISQFWPKEEIYGITSQIRRAAISINANIAEGYSRYHFKDKIRFYYQSRGSISEVQNFLILAKDLGYISENQSKELDLKANDVKCLLNGMIRSIEKQQK